MIVLQIVLAFGWMCVIPFLTGCILTKPLYQKQRWNLFYLTGIGLILQYAVYEILALAFIVLDKRFRLLSKVYAGVAVLLAVIGLVVLIRNRKELIACIKGMWEAEKAKGRRVDGYLIAALFLILIQVAAILFCATPDSDDAFYAGLSSMSIAGDYILKYDAYNGLMNAAISKRYFISALPVYQASLQLLCGKLHHLFITHNLFPLFYIPLANGLFYCVGKVLAPDDRAKQHRFLFFFVLLHLFGNTFVFSPQNFLMTRIWQGKALFICISLPLFFLFVNEIFTAKTKRGRWFSGLLLIPGLIGTVFMGETGLFLGPLMIIALVLAYATAEKLEK